MRKLLVAALAAMLCSAAGAATPVRVLYVFTTAAIVSQSQLLAGNTDVLGTVADQTTRELNAVYQASGINVDFQAAGIYTAPTTFSATSPAAAATAARNSYPIMKARDDSAADIVVVIGDFPYGTGSGGDSCSTTDPGAVVAIHTGITPSSIIAHEVGHCFNAQHSRSVNVKTGSTRTDCKVYLTIDVSSVDRSFAITEWRISEGGLVLPQGWGSTMGESLAMMSSFCPQANSGRWTYQCTPEACGTQPHTPPVPGDSALCFHQRVETYTDAWGTDVYVSHVGTPNSYGPTQFLCENVVQTNRFSGLGLIYKGVSMGDLIHDNVSFMLAKLTAISLYHTTPISPGIPH